MLNATTETDSQFDFQLDEFYLDLQEDGRNISILSTAEIAARPFPGLRPFKTSEFQLFRGRSGQAEELIRRLKRNRFLAVIGSSGTGKSSLVRAGLIPELFGGSLREAGSKWNIAVCRPGKNPIANLAVALSSVKGESKNKELLHKNFEAIEPLLNSSLYGLLEANEFLTEGQTKNEQANLLIIVDQFEEIFRYDRKDLGRENIENHFVDLLLKAASNQASPVYVIITMRSEFLGDCVKYRGLPEAINEGQYLVPGLNRTQLKDVIEGPVKAAGRSIAPGLVELLINELDEAKAKENLDQLPILQHALMRTYQEGTREGSTEIVYEHYQRIGGMEKALANHAREKFVELGDGNESDNVYSKKQQIAKVSFQALTDASTDLKGGRRPTELKNIYAIAASIGATNDEVDKVIDAFRDSETSFIMPPVNTPLHDDLIMDISHESLMRNWDLLKQWIDEEVRYGKFYQRLNERREEDGQFIQGTLLSELLNWRENYPHNAAWASRYHNLGKGQNNSTTHEELYNKNLLFLQRSEDAGLAAKDAEKNKILEEAKRQRAEEYRIQTERETARKRLLRFLSIALLLSIALVLWAFNERASADKEREKAKASFITAEEQRNRTIGLNEELKKQTQAAEAASDSAGKQRDLALQLYAQLKEQANILRDANDALSKQKAIAEKAQFSAQQYSVELEKRLAESYLHGQRFYTTRTLNPAEKNSIEKYLLTVPLNEEIDPDAKMIKMSLLNDINATVKAKEKLMDDPVTGLRMVQDVWRRNEKEPALEEIIPGIFKQNIFHASKIDLSGLDFLTSGLNAYTTSQNGQRFGFANEDQIVIGKMSNGGLEVQNLIEARKELAKANSNRAPAPGETTINAFAVPDNKAVALLVNDTNLIKWNENKNTRIQRLSNTEAIDLAQFSPDASLLATVSNRTTLKIWRLNDPKDTGKLRAIASLSLRGFKNIKRLQFSPDSARILAVYENGYGLYDTLTKKLQQQFERFRYGAAANFSNDGAYLLVSSSSAPNTVKMVGLDGELKASLTLSSANDNESFPTQLNDVSLSPDWKRLLVNYPEATYVYERTDGDSVFKQGENYRRSAFTNTAFSRKLFTFHESVSSAKFLRADEIAAFTREGTAYLYNVESKVLPLKEYFKKVSPIIDSTFEERKRAGTISFGQVVRSDEKDLLRQAANYYFESASNGGDQDEKVLELADTAYRLYLKMSAVDTGLSRIGNIKRLILLNEKLYNNEQNKYKQDTVTLIQYLTRNTNAREKLLEFQPDDTLTKDQLSLDYWNLSWLLNFKKRYTVAIQCANRSVELNQANNGAYTNLALAYLLKGDFADAEKVYSQYKDSVYADGTGASFRNSFLKDLEDMKSAGVIGTDNVPLNKEVLRIKNEILGEK